MSAHLSHNAGARVLMLRNGFNNLAVLVDLTMCRKIDCIYTLFFSFGTPGARAGLVGSDVGDDTGMMC